LLPRSPEKSLVIVPYNIAISEKLLEFPLRKSGLLLGQRSNSVRLTNWSYNVFMEGVGLRHPPCAPRKIKIEMKNKRKSLGSSDPETKEKKKPPLDCQQIDAR
jgi:hypothetical protein